MEHYVNLGGRLETGATISQLLDATLVIKTTGDHYHVSPIILTRNRRQSLSEAKGIVVYIFYRRLRFPQSLIHKLLYKYKHCGGRGSTRPWVDKIERLPLLHYQAVQIQRKLDVAPPPLTIPGIYELMLEWLHCERF